MHKSDIDHPEVQRLMDKIDWSKTKLQPYEGDPGALQEWHGPRVVQTEPQQ